MGFIEVANVNFSLPGGRVLFDDLSFKVPSGRHVAMVGANGVGKTTILRLLAGEDKAQEGVLRVEGRLGYMRQFVGSFDPRATVRDFFMELSDARLRRAGFELRRFERVISGAHGQAAQLRYAQALAEWGEAGGYEAEVLWDTVTSASLHKPMSTVADRNLSTLSGGEQKRLALEAFWRSDAEVLLLDEPDNFLDIPGKQWLEQSMNASRKTILYVSHDRTMLANTAHAFVTLEGLSAWTHHGAFDGYGHARVARLGRIEEERRRFAEEHKRIVEQIKEFKRRAAMNDKFASKARAAQKKLERHGRDNAPRLRPQEQDIKMDLGGGRTGKLVLCTEALSFPGLVEPFSAEVYFGERVGVVGPNGTGKSHFLELLAGRRMRYEGVFKLGARVEPALFSQLHERADLTDGKPIVEVLKERGLELGRAIARLKRYELHESMTHPFSLLSGGQQARFQILLMEIASPTMLLLDEPTDNLDIDSAEALEVAFDRYQGTVVMVTHDRWVMAALDRFLVFESDGSVRQSLSPPYNLGSSR